jgi:glyceraldehyde-3-phosphate dehydrogenase/erythrose-4-phosphate dehydrogenase
MTRVGINGMGRIGRLALGCTGRFLTPDTLLKVYAWYGHEMGCACRKVDLACHLQAQGL